MFALEQIMLTLDFLVANQYIKPAAGYTTVTSTGPKVCYFNESRAYILRRIAETLVT